METPRRVSLERRADGVALLTLVNPPLNLNTLASIEQLLETCSALSVDPNVRVLVVTGAGERAFCAGSDIKEFADVRGDVVAQKLGRENAAFTALAELPMPVIAALNGNTLGGGAEIALACDIRIMDETARIGFPEVKLGVFPGSGGVFRLPNIVGEAHAFELLYTGELIDAEEAYRIGLINRIAKQGQSLSVAIQLAQTLALRPALALSLIKSGVKVSFNQTTAEATEQTLADSHKVFTGPDIEEGVSAFFEKRAPHFTSPRPLSHEELK